MALININPEKKKELLKAAVKSETSRRINEVLKDQITQLNMTAYSISLARAENKNSITPAQLQHLNLLNTVQVWVFNMRQKGRELAAAGDESFRDDRHWPPPPEGVKAFVESF